MTRGVDFRGVKTVINVDAPSSVQGYVHRVGRTGRAGQSGVALTFFTPQNADLQDQIKSSLRKQASHCLSHLPTLSSSTVSWHDLYGRTVEVCDITAVKAVSMESSLMVLVRPKMPEHHPNHIGAALQVHLGQCNRPACVH